VGCGTTIASLERMANVFCGATVLATLFLAACARTDSIGPGDTLPVGTWGGEGAGLIVEDTIAHVHINCTFGNFAGPITLDDNRRFNVAGEYVLRTYPVMVGPPQPAQFAGVIESNTLTLTVAVNDTTEKKLVALGPVVVYLGREPNLGPCPICRKPTAVR